MKNEWKDGKTRQRVLATLGRLDLLVESGELDAVLRSGTRFAKSSISCTELPDDESLLSSHQVSRLLQVSPSTVVSWTNSGRLQAFRTPGGHRRVKLRELRSFLQRSNLPLPPELQASSPAAKHRVFVVDDEPLVIRTIQRVLEPYDSVEVEGCTDGLEALVEIGAFQPDLVLLDIHMEGIDGFEVCRRLNRVSRTWKLAIVAITALPSEEDRARILGCGALAYWTKPIHPQAVLELLKAEEKQGVA